MTYDPAFTNTASCRSAITYIDGDNGHPRVPRLPDRAARREVDLPRGRLPAGPRRAAHPGAARRVDARDHDPHVRARERQGVHAAASATTRTRWGCCSARSARCRRSTPTPTRSRTPTTATIQTIRLIAKMPTLAAFAYRHTDGHAVRLSGQRPVATRATSSNMMYKMTELKYEPDPRLERALDILFILHADHEQNCSTNAVRVGRLLAGRPVLGGRRRRRRALRPAARRRQRGRAADAHAHRDQGQHPGLHQGREGRRREADGLRPPRLQELRPARQDHQDGRRRRLRGHRASTRCWRSRTELEKIALEDDYFI